ncbi:MAG: cupredoxin domain-containing protein [Bdellovibrionales bacterium]|nr:cupredoxin domain-containing protein [Bdellovibrionales bacterium]
MKESAPEGRAQDTTIFDHLISSQSREGVQEIVILNTEGGFIPNTVRVREGESYKIHVVNVNEKEKNVSFVMDSFSEHHATYFGKMRSFVMSPKKEGIYSFVCPETSAQGRVVVHAVSAEAGIRRPASEE